MVSSDTVVGIVGAVILTGAMIAVFYYENTGADGTPTADIGEGDMVFTYAFAQDNETTHDAEDVTVQAGAPSTINVDAPGYTFSIHVEVTWATDPAVGGAVPVPRNRDTMKVELIDPSGNVSSAPDSSDSGSIVAHWSVDMARPADLRVAAADEATANATLDEDLGGRANAGRWQVRITLENTNDQPAAIDTDQLVTYTVTVGSWRATLTA